MIRTDKTLDDIHSAYTESSERFISNGLMKTNIEAMNHIAELKAVIVDLVNLYSTENSKFVYLQIQHMKCGK